MTHRHRAGNSGHDHRHIAGNSGHELIGPQHKTQK